MAKKGQDSPIIIDSERIKKLLKEKRIKQVVLSEKLDYAPESLNRALKNGKIGKFADLEIIAKELDVHPVYFLKDKNGKNILPDYSNDDSSVIDEQGVFIKNYPPSYKAYIIEKENELLHYSQKLNNNENDKRLYALYEIKNGIDGIERFDSESLTNTITNIIEIYDSICQNKRSGKEIDEAMYKTLVEELKKRGYK